MENQLLRTLRTLPLIIVFVLLFQAANASVSGVDLLSGQKIEVAPGKLGTVVIFMSSKCPCSNSHLPLVKKLAEDFKEFSFLVVHSNADESDDSAKRYFAAANLSFPVLQDEKTKLADQFKANKTPHAFVLDANGKVLYQGGVTNSATASTADRQYLREALNDVEAGRPVKMAYGRTLGCAISRSH